ncbi:MAG: NUDIX hydrolase [Patescibacteria group bacterium]
MAGKEFSPVPKEQAVWKEHTKASASVSIFLSDKLGRLLMVQDVDQYGGKWSPIAGFVDVAYNEEPEMAALREAKEELGLTIRLDELIGVWHYYADDDKDAVAYGKESSETAVDKAHMHIGYSYRGTILDGTFIMQEDEIQNYGFFTPEEVEQLYKDGKLKTPQYNYVGFKLWEKGTKHPLTVVQSNSRATLT